MAQRGGWDGIEVRHRLSGGDEEAVRRGHGQIALMLPNLDPAVPASCTLDMTAFDRQRGEVQSTTTFEVAPQRQLALRLPEALNRVETKDLRQVQARSIGDASGSDPSRWVLTLSQNVCGPPGCKTGLRLRRLVLDPRPTGQTSTLDFGALAPGKYVIEAATDPANDYAPHGVVGAWYLDVARHHPKERQSQIEAVLGRFPDARQKTQSHGAATIFGAPEHLTYRQKMPNRSAGDGLVILSAEGIRSARKLPQGRAVAGVLAVQAQWPHPWELTSMTWKKGGVLPVVEQISLSGPPLALDVKLEAEDGQRSRLTLSARSFAGPVDGWATVWIADAASSRSSPQAPDVSLFWRRASPLGLPSSLFQHLLGPDGTPLLTEGGVPGGLPPCCWAASTPPRRDIFSTTPSNPILAQDQPLALGGTLTVATSPLEPGQDYWVFAVVTEKSVSVEGIRRRGGAKIFLRAP
jgi:hypothetical protein